MLAADVALLAWLIFVAVFITLMLAQVYLAARYGAILTPRDVLTGGPSDTMPRRISCEQRGGGWIIQYGNSSAPATADLLVVCGRGENSGS